MFSLKGILCILTKGERMSKPTEAVKSKRKKGSETSQQKNPPKKRNPSAEINNLKKEDGWMANKKIPIRKKVKEPLPNNY